MCRQVIEGEGDLKRSVRLRCGRGLRDAAPRMKEQRDCNKPQAYQAFRSAHDAQCSRQFPPLLRA